LLQDVAEIFVQQAESADGDGDEQQRLGEFESRNENQPAVVAMLFGKSPGCALDKFLCLAAPIRMRAPMDTLNDGGRFSQCRLCLRRLYPAL